MLSIDRAEWIFQFVEILQNRNSIVVCHYLIRGLSITGQKFRSEKLISNRIQARAQGDLLAAICPQCASTLGNEAIFLLEQ
jgi:hypothetical protein